MAKNITEITRRDIFDLLNNGMQDPNDFLGNKTIYFRYYGRLNEIDFLKRIYDLDNMPSYDSRYANALGDIIQHTKNNDDYEDGWVFEDERFSLINGNDDILLKFLCEMFHPAVRIEKGEWKIFLSSINSLLKADGYELFPYSKISGRDVYNWREVKDLDSSVFIPYTERNKINIHKKYNFRINKKARQQIYAILEQYQQIYSVTNTTGWVEDFYTDQMVMKDIKRFYEPHCYKSEKYMVADTLYEFIMGTMPYCIFDAIEFYEKYNKIDSFSNDINSILKNNCIQYEIEDGKIINIEKISFDKKAIKKIHEKGLRDLLQESITYFEDSNYDIALNKIWDAYERMKTILIPGSKKKKQSTESLITDISEDCIELKNLLTEEFLKLTEIGNNYRIRHHETNKIDIPSDNIRIYFYNRCLSLILSAIPYLQED